MNVLIVNINLDPTTLDGCNAIAAALERVATAAGTPPTSASIETRVRPWRTLIGTSGALAPDLQKWGPAAVVIGPNETPFPAYPPAFDRFLGWLRARRGPTLGICGGHQALALAHGAPVAPVHKVAAATTSYAGMPRVSGPQRIRLLGDPDPIVVGLPDEVVVMASHVDEVKDVPPGFRVLALGDPSRIQILRADRRPMWGVQFHPERPVPPEAAGAGPEPWGDRILGNFLELAAAWRARARSPDDAGDAEPGSGPT
ncbi:MAG: gamma-glutamyl-gamma-aminobutyrate hydrolase family protein [Deltaproteobacteria bacterium]|nr:gamma-glutamyl-gamma-aminobutyrate hydrolase family protein [Deltaproteobacteria bacterium]